MSKNNNLKMRFNISVDLKKGVCLFFDNVNQKEYLIRGWRHDKRLDLCGEKLTVYGLINIKDEINYLKRLLDVPRIDDDPYLDEELIFKLKQIEQKEEKLFYTGLKSLYKLEKKGIEFLFIKHPCLMYNIDNYKNKYVTENNCEEFNLICEEIIKAYAENKKDNVA